MDNVTSKQWPPNLATISEAVRTLEKYSIPADRMSIHPQDWSIMASSAMWFAGVMFDLDTREPYLLGVPVKHPDDAVPGTIRVYGKYGNTSLLIQHIP